MAEAAGPVDRNPALFAGLRRARLEGEPLSVGHVIPKERWNGHTTNLRVLCRRPATPAPRISATTTAHRFSRMTLTGGEGAPLVSKTALAQTRAPGSREKLRDGGEEPWIRNTPADIAESRSRSRPASVP
jgi:hypothetical protein